MAARESVWWPLKSPFGGMRLPYGFHDGASAALNSIPHQGDEVRHCGRQEIQEFRHCKRWSRQCRRLLGERDAHLGRRALVQLT